MAVRVTLTGILDDFWGADETFDSGGQASVRELLEEDLSAMMENLSLKVEKIEDEPKTIPPLNPNRVEIGTKEIGFTLEDNTPREPIAPPTGRRQRTR